MPTGDAINKVDTVFSAMTKPATTSDISTAITQLREAQESLNETRAYKKALESLLLIRLRKAEEHLKEANTYEKTLESLLDCCIQEKKKRSYSSRLTVTTKAESSKKRRRKRDVSPKEFEILGPRIKTRKIYTIPTDSDTDEENSMLWTRDSIGIKDPATQPKKVTLAENQTAPDTTQNDSDVNRNDIGLGEISGGVVSKRKTSPSRKSQQ